MTESKDTIPGKSGDPTNLSLGQDLGAKLKAFSKTLREIMYGFTIHELDMEIRKERGHIDDLFMLAVFGDLVGLPLFPPTTPSGSCPTSFPPSITGKEESSGKETLRNKWPLTSDGSLESDK